MKNNTLLLAGLVIVVVLGGVGGYTMMGKKTAMVDKSSDTAVADSMMEKTSVTAGKTDSMEKPSDGMEKPNDGMEKPADSMEPTEVMMEKSGSYVPFSPQVLSTTVGTRRVLFFYASWCPTCKPADADFSQNSSQIPADVTVIRVNYNDPDTDQSEKDLAKKYNVTYQHTYVQIDADGKEVTKWNGGKLNELLAKIK